MSTLGYQFDTNKLKGKIVEVYGTQAKFAEAVGNSVSYISQVMNGKAYLDQPTIDKWSTALRIDTDDIGTYFFVPKVHETEQ